MPWSALGVGICAFKGRDMEILGFLDGEICNRDGCDGIIEQSEIDSCSCHINPPCPACTEPRGYCPKCDWDEKEEPVVIPKTTEADKKFLAELIANRDKPLDNTKINWKSYSHTHFSMIKEGVYPEGTTKAEVLNKVNGTFGGRFEHFGNGRFKFIAYTD